MTRAGSGQPTEGGANPPNPPTPEAGETFPNTSADGGMLTDPLTFVFTDVAGSTKLWAADPEGTARSFVVHDSLVRSVLAAHGGIVFGWAGDSFRAVFDDRRRALNACDRIHAALARARWAGDPPLRVRIGVTHGQALHRDGEYFGPVANTAARLQEAAQPGQTVASSAVVAGLGEVAITSLGAHRVRDVAEELELFQLGTQRFPPLRTVDAARSTLPPTPGALVGRSTSLRNVRAALDDDRPVTIVGTGGAGKTRLALEVAHLELSDHPDGCYFVDLAAVTEPDDVIAAVARSSRFEVDGSDPLGQIVDWFASRRALLVLDNCEHVRDEVGRVVSAVATGASSVDILSTSREALGVASEIVIPLGPLSTSHDGGPAVELFVNRIRESVADFDPTTAELAKIAQICQHLDGIPLALELAAARSGVLGLDLLLDGMHDRFRVLSSHRGDGTRTLREAIDWSFGMLTELEQGFFARCGVFNGPFDLRSAAAVAPDIDPLDLADLLHSLSGKSLISSEGALGGRFRLLETMRAYALLRLRERGLEAETRRLHFEHMHDLVAVSDLAAAHDLDRAARLAPDWSNIAGALDWGVEAERWAEVASLASGCLGLWEQHVPAIEARRWIDRVIDELPGESTARGLLAFVSSTVEAQLDNFARVHDLLGELTESAEPQVQATTSALVGYLTAREAPAQSEAFFERAHSLAAKHQLGFDVQVTIAWAEGSHALYTPDLDRAHRHFQRGFEIAHAAPRRTASTIYAGLGLVVTQLLLDRPADALATLDSYDWSRSRWDSSAMLRGVALIDLGRAGEAADLIFAFAHDSLLGRLPRMSNDAMLGLTALALHRGESDHAWHLLNQAVTPRTPFTIGLAEGLAGRIGRGDELRAIHRGRQVSLAELDAIDQLRVELGRLSDAATAQADRTTT